MGAPPYFTWEDRCYQRLFSNINFASTAALAGVCILLSAITRFHDLFKGFFERPGLTCSNYGRVINFVDVQLLDTNMSLTVETSELDYCTLHPDHSVWD